MIASLSNIKSAVTIPLIMAIVSCFGHGDGGDLVPVESAGAKNPNILISGKTVRLTSDTVTAEITGSWSSPGMDSVIINYKNNGNKLFNFKWTNFTLQNERLKLPLSVAYDESEMNFTDNRNDNDTSVLIYQNYYPSYEKKEDIKPLDYTIFSNTKKQFNLGFSHFPRNISKQDNTSIESGSVVTITFAMPDGPVAVKFRRD